MTLNKRQREQMLAHCGEIHDDDGVDPREFFKTHRSQHTTDRKTNQLCAQIAETLSLVLAGDFGDELLHNLQIVSVKPAPDASQLAVAVRVDMPERDVDAQQVLESIHRVVGWLRTEVASVITRKRVPKLVFHVVEMTGDGEVQP